MNIEEQLISQFGKERHFKVPDGYFEHFTDQMMALLPEQPEKLSQKRPMWQRLMPKLSVAAMLAVMFSIGAYFHFAHQSQPDGERLLAKPSTVAKTATSFDQAADYVMLDETDMYAYLSDY